MFSRLGLFNLVAALFVAAGATIPARASDAISAPAMGKSASVTQPHVVVELIPEATTVRAGKPFEVALHLHMDPGWHTYWINPGDAGLATSIKWALPLGWMFGQIEWPTPEKHAMGPLTTYGYGGDVYLLMKIVPQAPDHQARDVTIHAHASWLVCQEECIPGKADLALKLHVVGVPAAPDSSSAANHELFAAARARLPVPNTLWNISGTYGADRIVLTFQRQPNGNPAQPISVDHLVFFSEQANVLAAGHPELVTAQTKSADMPDGFAFTTGLAQNGEKPDHLSGVLISDHPLGEAKAIYLAAFPVSGGAPPASSPASTAPSARHPEPVAGSVPPAAGVGATLGAGNSGLGQNPAGSSSHLILIQVLVLAFCGGIILNLMPCVLPVLSLKVFSLIRHAGENSGTAWRQGVAFTVGVVLSFWILAGLLLALRAAGNHLGWGFQMQSPGFVLALTFLFFLLGLNLFGVFELGASLVGVDAKASSHLGGLTSSFANGALATLAATPCTAPFMGSAVGFAAQQPAAISLLIFTFLALGMAAPYLALTTFPGALRLVPRPGAWMESLRQFMGFLLMGTVIFLVYVFGALVNEDQIPSLLGALLFAGFAVWIYGRWSSPVHSTAARATAVLVALGLLIFAINWGVELARAVPASSSEKHADAEDWQVYSPEAVKAALAANRPVFVDFTAAWCLSCKVNERVALEVDSTKQAFAQKHVALFRGDWTHSDPEISQTLRKYNRDGVPLYLLYSPKNPDVPQVLPEVLTPEIVQNAVLGGKGSPTYGPAWWIGLLVISLAVLGVLAGVMKRSKRDPQPPLSGHRPDVLQKM